MEQHINYITLGVADLAESRRFYREVFGWQETADSNENIAFFQAGNALLLALFGSYLAAKLFGIILPDVSATGIFPHTDVDGHTEKPPIPTDEYPDDIWDYPAEDRYEDEDVYAYEDDLPPAEDLYDDWDDWNEGYDDDHFS